MLVPIAAVYFRKELRMVTASVEIGRLELNPSICGFGDDSRAPCVLFTANGGDRVGATRIPPGAF